MCEYDVHTRLILAYESSENFKNREATVLEHFDLGIPWGWHKRCQ